MATKKSPSLPKKNPSLSHPKKNPSDRKKKSFGRKKRNSAEEDMVDFGNMMLTLNNGNDMPAVGIGTFRIKKKEDIFTCVDNALAVGYRHFDTAAVYHNEAYLGEAFKSLLPKYKLTRDDIFICTKLSPSEHGDKDVVRRACMRSLQNMGIEYIDLYLIHFPGTSKLNVKNERNKKLREDTWEAMNELYNEGLVNAIGVSNFTIRHLEDLEKIGHFEVPAVNQVEWHPFYHQPELLEYCKKRDIILQAYSSFGGTSVEDCTLIEHPVVKKIAQKLEVTCAQLLLVWALQQNVAVIPKSTNPDRIKENKTLKFRIPEDDMRQLFQLGEMNHKFAWNPTDVY